MEVEAALTQGKDMVTFLLDYVKFFDMFQPDWVRDFLIHTGFDPDMAYTIHNLYTNLRRRIKLRRNFGPISRPADGMAAGDSLALMVALVFVSTQFHYLTQHHRRLRMGACVDDRNIRGTYDDVVQAYYRIMRFDAAAGHFNKHKKLHVTRHHHQKSCAS